MHVYFNILCLICLEVSVVLFLCIRSFNMHRELALMGEKIDLLLLGGEEIR